MRALDYPFAIPDRSFAFADGRLREPDELDIDVVGRTALLAYGSNAAPEMLERKLADDPDPALLLRAGLADFDVVYSAHLSAYGAVPATLQPSPGTTATMFVAYFTTAQLELVALTEPNYELTKLKGIRCLLDASETLTEADAYLSRHGCLLDDDGSPIALAAIEARDRILPEMTQRQAQARFAAVRPKPR